MTAQLGPVIEEAADLALRLQFEVKHSVKHDGSVVSEADKAVEEFLRPRLRHIHDCAIIGEEFAPEGDTSLDCWFVDPIDGTGNYIHGSDLWGVTVGLRSGGKIVLGAVTLPVLKEAYLAASGNGATLNAQPLSKLETEPVHDFSLIGYGRCEVVLDQYHRIRGKMRHHGAFVVEAMHVAKGIYSAMVVGRTNLYDMAGSLCILKEVGAQFLTLHGEPLDVESASGAKRLEPFLIAGPGDPKQTGLFR